MKRLALLVLVLMPLAAICQEQPAPAGPAPSAASPAAAQQAPAPSPAATTLGATDKTTMAAHATPAPAGSAIVIFYRPKRFMDSTFKPSVYVDDKTIGRIGNGENFKVKVPAGAHKIFSNDKSTGTDLDAKAGETYYIRIDMKTGLTTARGAVTLVEKQEGAFEVTQTKQVLDVDITGEPGPPPPPPLAPSSQQPPLGPPLPPPQSQP